MLIIKPPDRIRTFEQEPAVFLAGSIEMNAAVDWQAEITELLNKRFPEYGVILNPRRDNWDPSWEQGQFREPFRSQVLWELNALDRATHIVMYFDPKTKSPISLLELGLYATSGKLIVCCPEGFWRKGNVDIVCARYHIPTVDSLTAAVSCIAQSQYALLNA